MKEWQKKYIDEVKNKIQPKHIGTETNKNGFIETLEREDETLINMQYVKSQKNTVAVMRAYELAKRQNKLKIKRKKELNEARQKYVNRQGTFFTQSSSVKMSPMRITNFHCSLDTKQSFNLKTLFDKYTTLDQITTYNDIKIELQKLTLQKARFKPLVEFNYNYGKKTNSNAEPQTLSMKLKINGHGTSISIWPNGKIFMMGSIISKNITLNTTKQNIGNDIKKVPKILQNYITLKMTDAQKKNVNATRFGFNNLAGMFTFNKNPDFISKKPPSKDTFYKHKRTGFVIDLNSMKFKQPKLRKERSNKKTEGGVNYEALGISLPSVTNKVNELQNPDDWKFALKADLKKNIVLPMEMRKKKNQIYKFKGISYIPVWNEDKTKQMFMILIATNKLAPGAIIKIQGVKGTQDTITQNIIDAYRITTHFLGWTFHMKYSKGNTNNVIKLDPKEFTIKKQEKHTSCPSDKRPNPYSFEGKCPNGYHVRPNKQGRPCCYKDQQNKAYMRSRIVEAYKQAGIKIPPSIKKMYLLKNNVNNKNTKTIKMPTRIEGGRLILGSKQCERYTKYELRDIAKRMGVVGVDKMKKAEICKEIKNKTKNRNITKHVGTNALTVKVAGSDRSMVMVGNTLKLIKTKGGSGQGMACISFTQQDLKNIAGKLGIGTSSTPSKTELCREITKYVLNYQKITNTKIKKVVITQNTFANSKNSKFLRYKDIFKAELHKLSKGKIKVSPEFLQKSFNAFFTTLPESEERGGSQGQGSVHLTATYKVNNKPNLVLPRRMRWGEWVKRKPYVYNKKNFSYAGLEVYKMSYDKFAKMAASHYKSFYA